jgi:hypothetical protein
VELIEGARSLAIRQVGPALTLYVDGVPVEFEDGSDGSWISEAVVGRPPAIGFAVVTNGDRAFQTSDPLPRPRTS